MSIILSKRCHNNRSTTSFHLSLSQPCFMWQSCILSIFSNKAEQNKSSKVTWDIKSKANIFFGALCLQSARGESKIHETPKWRKLFRYREEKDNPHTEEDCLEKERVGLGWSDFSKGLLKGRKTFQSSGF